MPLPFPIVPCPRDYGGKSLWFTLRFANPIAAAPKGIAWGDFVWSGGERTEWIDGGTLAIGDTLPTGPIVDRVAMAGVDCWKIESGNRSFTYVPVASLAGKRIERVAKGDNKRATLEFEGEPAKFDDRQLEKLLAKIHAQYPLIAVLFQDGNWFDGEPLDELPDAALLARLARQPPRR